MVGDDHDGARPIERIDTPAGVGDEQGLDVHEFHDADREDDLLLGVAFVKVKPPLHGDHVFP